LAHAQNTQCFKTIARLAVLQDPNDLLVYSTMPIRHLTGFSKMPIIGLTTGDNMPVKKVTIIYPLDVVTP
jgi:hypothetical protein